MLGTPAVQAKSVATLLRSEFQLRFQEYQLVESHSSPTANASIVVFIVVCAAVGALPATRSHPAINHFTYPSSTYNKY